MTLRKAEWSHVHLSDAQWRIPDELLTMREDLIVPLSRQSMDILEELYPATGRGRYLFPCEEASDRSMSENTINAARPARKAREESEFPRTRPTDLPPCR